MKWKSFRELIWDVRISTQNFPWNSEKATKDILLKIYRKAVLTWIFVPFKMEDLEVLE
jgi:hypothetical protein